MFLRMLILAKGRVPPSVNISDKGPSTKRVVFQEEVFAHWKLLETLLQNEAITIEIMAQELKANIAEISRKRGGRSVVDYMGRFSAQLVLNFR